MYVLFVETKLNISSRGKYKVHTKERKRHFHYTQNEWNGLLLLVRKEKRFSVIRKNRLRASHTRQVRSQVEHNIRKKFHPPHGKLMNHLLRSLNESNHHRHCLAWNTHNHNSSRKSLNHSQKKEQFVATWIRTFFSVEWVFYELLIPHSFRVKICRQCWKFVTFLDAGAGSAVFMGS